MAKTVAMSLDASGCTVHLMLASRTVRRRLVPACGAGIDFCESLRRVPWAFARPLCQTCRLKLEKIRARTEVEEALYEERGLDSGEGSGDGTRPAPGVCGENEWMGE
jgi:hypothetical protein